MGTTNANNNSHDGDMMNKISSVFGFFFFYLFFMKALQQARHQKMHLPNLRRLGESSVRFREATRTVARDTSLARLSVIEQNHGFVEKSTPSDGY
jgi:hypothetical protein